MPCPATWTWARWTPTPTSCPASRMSITPRTSPFLALDNRAAEKRNAMKRIKTFASSVMYLRFGQEVQTTENIDSPVRFFTEPSCLYSKCGQAPNFQFRSFPFRHLQDFPPTHGGLAGPVIFPQCSLQLERVWRYLPMHSEYAFCLGLEYPTSYKLSWPVPHCGQIALALQGICGLSCWLPIQLQSTFPWRPRCVAQTKTERRRPVRDPPQMLEPKSPDFPMRSAPDDTAEQLERHWEDGKNEEPYQQHCKLQGPE